MPHWVKREPPANYSATVAPGERELDPRDETGSRKKSDANQTDNEVATASRYTLYMLVRGRPLFGVQARIYMWWRRLAAQTTKEDNRFDEEVKIANDKTIDEM